MCVSMPPRRYRALLAAVLSGLLACGGGHSRPVAAAPLSTSATRARGRAALSAAP